MVVSPTNCLLAPLYFLHQTQHNKNVSFYFYAPFHLFHFSLSTIATQTTHLSLYAREGVAAILKDFSFCVLKSLDVLIDILFFSFQTKRNFLKIDKLRVQRLRPIEIEIEFRGIDNPSRSPVEAHLKIELRLNFE